MTYTPEIESAFHRLRVMTLRGESETDVADYHSAREHLAYLLKSSELHAIAKWIRTPGNINRDDAIDDCARALENRAADLLAAAQNKAN